MRVLGVVRKERSGLVEKPFMTIRCAPKKKKYRRNQRGRHIQECHGSVDLRETRGMHVQRRQCLGKRWRGWGKG